MDLLDLYCRISIDTSEFDNGINNASKTFEDFSKTLRSLMNRAASSVSDGLEDVTDEMEDQEGEIRNLARAHENASRTFRDTARESQTLESRVSNLSGELNQSERAARNAEDGVDRLTQSLDDAGDSTGSFGGLFDDLVSKFKSGLVVGAVVGSITALTGAMSSLVDETQEYRQIMGTLEVSSKNAGYSADETRNAYMRLYSVLGDSQTAATTTANLQAIGLEQKSLMEILDSAIGAWATYGDSIPIDGLAESINETIRAGQVTGTFADVLNWGSQENERFGVTMRASTEANKEWNDAVADAQTAEDYFNLALQNCQTEAERADLVLRTMAEQGLTQAGDKWLEVNDGIVATNEAQAKYEEAQAELAERLVPFKTKLTELATGGFDFLTTAIDKASQAIRDLGDWWKETQPKLESGWDKFWGIESGSHYGRLPDGSYGWRTVDGSHAAGLEEVPFDGYIAQLHKGEMILPADMAEKFRVSQYGNVDFASSSMGAMSAGIINGLSGGSGGGFNGSLTVKLMMPDGKEFASYILDPLIEVARSNGTPIANPQRA